ncbi:MAG: HEPN domain-containing protein [archaeon GBS-70-058]|nr:HEPN domain-containing protein [Candidatus Culexarchaeum nevadense]
MKLINIAKSYLKQADARLRDAEEALEEGLNPYALRLSQECVELSLKAALKIVAIEYPKKHDVSDVLIQVKERFPEWFQREVDFLANTSRTLAKKRSVSMYGDETFALSPEEVISSEEARIAVENARKTYSLCKKLLNELKYM